MNRNGAADEKHDPLATKGIKTKQWARKGKTSSKKMKKFPPLVMVLQHQPKKKVFLSLFDNLKV